MDKNCEHCGETFRVKDSRADRVRYCQPACRKAHEAEHGRERTRKEGITFSCQQCAAEFKMMPGAVAMYRKRHGKDPKYCSSKCFGASKHEEAKRKHIFTCKQCGELKPRRRYVRSDGNIKYDLVQELCSVACKNEWLKDLAAGRFLRGETGRHIKRGGYVWLSIPANVSRTGEKMEMLEHRYVMERHIGRELFPHETVHHVNGDRTNNSITNLELWSSRHGPGQRVIDKIRFAIETIRMYPELAASEGVTLVDNPGPHDD